MWFSLIVKLLMLAALMGNAFFHVSCLYFNFTSFTGDRLAELNYEESAVAKNAIQVTYDLSGPDRMQNLVGRAFYKKPFTLWRKLGESAAFNSTFVINMVNETIPGGEGMAFLLTGTQDLPDDSAGQWLGIVNETTNGTSAANIVAIEFDTRKSFPGDIDDNHIGLDVNSISSIKQVPSTVNLSTGNNITVHVQYDSKNMTVFVGDDMENPVFSVPIDLSEHLPQKVYVGFSASTSNYTERNSILSWQFSGPDIGKNSRMLWVLIVVLAVVLVLALSRGFRFYLYRKRRNEIAELQDVNRIENQIYDSTLAPRKFKLRELQKATGKFSPKNKLGKGGFGTVYKGTWRNKDIAVKRVSETSRQGEQEFIAEVTTIGTLRHRNLVKLIGWCYEKQKLLLVYEYMPNGSLDRFIFVDEKTGMGESTLNWETRLTIIHGTAQALDYLHNGCEKRVLHRDIKSSNIMLDSDFNAKLGDFGLARTIQDQKTHHTTNEIAGTPGYMAPEIFLTGRATVETDVYAFGVLILEVACRRKPARNKFDQNSYNNSIVHWLWELHRKGRLLDAADSRWDEKFSEEEMERVLILGLACCHPNPHLRPSMKLVLHVLSGEAAAPEVPIERPSFVWPAMPPPFSSSDCSLAGSQLTPFSEIIGR